MIVCSFDIHKYKMELIHSSLSSIKLTHLLEREILISTITAISVALSLLLYVNTFSTDQVIAIYLFDAMVTVILIYDFCDRLKKSDGKKNYLSKHLYELPALFPLIFLAISNMICQLRHFSEQ